MERKEFRQRIKELLAWALVMMLGLNSMQGSLVTIYAEEIETTIPVNYYEVYSEDDPSLNVVITEENIEGNARITSTDYTTEVTVASDATSISGVVLPTVEKDGYFFMDWSFGISGGYYDPDAQSWALGYITAADVTEIPLVAYFQEIYKSVITYDYTGGTMNGVADTTSVELAQPDADTYEFKESVTTSVPAMLGKIFTGWSMEESDMGVYESEIGTVSGYYGSDYTLSALWRDENIINISYLISDDNVDKGTISETESKVSFYESEDTAPVEVTPPEVTLLSEEYIFVGWTCEEEGKAVEDLGGFTEDYQGTGINCYPAGTTFSLRYPEPTSAEEGTIVGGQSAAYTMTAQFAQADTLTVTYDTNGGTGIENTQEIIYQSTLTETQATITLPEEEPTYGTYTFTGWLCSADSNVYEAGAEVGCAYEKGSVTFTAQWECTLPVTYNTDGGTITSTEYDEEVILSINATSAEAVMLPTVEKEGYFFLNWGLELSSGGTYSAGEQDLSWDSTTPASSLTEIPFTANWQEAKQATIIYEYTDGIMDESEDTYTTYVVQTDVSKTSFETSVITSIPTKEGYIFTGWEIQTTTTGSYDSNTGMITGNYDETYILSAQWRPENTIIITTSFESGYENVGTIIDDIAGIYYESSNIDDNGNVSVYLPEMTDVEVGNLFVGWKCYDANGEEYVAGDSYVDDYMGTGVSCYSSRVELQIPYPTDENNVGGNTAVYVFEAQFIDAVTVPVTFDANGGNGLTTTTDTAYQMAINEERALLTLPAALTKEGFEFLGWLCSEDNSLCDAGSIYSVSITSRAVTYTAQWNELEYTILVTYDTDDGTITSTDYTQEVKLLAMANTAEAVELPTAEKEGYFFKYWKLTNSEDGEYAPGIQYLTWGEEQPAYTLSGLELKAYWQEALQSTITYDLNGGTLYNSQTNPTRDYVQPDIDTDMFYESVIEGNPEKTGYTFNGWLLAATDGSSYEDGEVTGYYGTDYTLTAQWVENMCTISITYDTDGGTISSTDYATKVHVLATATGAENVILPSAEKEGYYFKGWTLQGGNGQLYSAGSQNLAWSTNSPAYTLSGLELTANWEEAPKSIITYNLNGGTLGGSETAPTQTFIQPDKNTSAFSESVIEGTPEKNGYAFLGWSMNLTDTSGYDEESGLITGLYGTDYTLTALWEEMTGAGTFTLRAGEKYRLAEGSWTVSGDTTVYTGGGYFYVSEDGDYTFTEE